MRKQHLFCLIMSVFVWCSCSKTEIKPTAAPGTALHINNTASDAVTYTTSNPINLNGSHDITISGKAINGGSVPAITLSNCYNVHITQNNLGNSSDVGIYLYNCHNITVDYNYITKASAGVYVDNAGDAAGGIIVNNNQFLNIMGPFPRGQFVQFNTVSGPGNSISYNKGENILGQSDPQEAINLYKSNGTSSSPIQVNGNWIRGGGPAPAGGGIQLGDNGGSYIVASGNIMVNPGQAGISISGGDHISAINNTVYAKSQYFTNVGIVVWGQAGYAVTNSTVSGNKIKYSSADGSENDNWIGPGTATPSGWNTNTWGANIDASILPAVIVSLATAAGPTTSTPTTTTAVTTTTTTPATTGTVNSAPVNMTGKSNVTISGLSITGGSLPCIKLTNCSNVYIARCNLGNSSIAGIELDNCQNVVMENNNIFNVPSGVVASNCPYGNIQVLTNQMKNMSGTGSFVRFLNVNGSNNNISYNKLENIAGSSNSGNAIDIAQSSGISSSPIQINGNWIRGGGPSSSAGGIYLGDQGGAYQVAQNNILVNPGSFGMAISGGDHISVTNNSIYASAQSFTNVGIYVWSESGHAITNSTVSGNQVNFANAQNVKNGSWLASGQATPAGWSTDNWAANISASILPTVVVSF